MNRTSIQLFFICLLMAVIGYFGLIYEKAPQWRGILVKKEPIQRMIKKPKPFKYKKFFITPLADYSITGVVISTERYFFDPTSSISPIDVALAWKKMSMPEVITEFKFKHRRRCLLYSPKKGYWPIMEHDIRNSISNNHCIPANKDIKKKLFKIKQYDLVTIKGQLVKAEKPGMMPWTSSLSRNDTSSWGEMVGCEIIYVTDVEILEKQ
ncbi:hypothetical protein [Candidatus Ruminimicrobiellum ovillum]|uniref:hypothetical protein n=1 Tax=Candidatus Ruminimicrobiellum ovillum TaxID=1947927 RepID=UPI00355946B3